MSKRNKWSFKDKLGILKEAEQLGTTATIRKHGINYASYYNWKKKYEEGGEPALATEYQRVSPEIKKLQVENFRLKQLLADKELELQIKNALLKKTQYRNKIK